ncbi:MAG TPA: FmdB family zinc ribbon protein [Thermoanaerobaculia bacterium]|jgi:putative FmdB family regulatory protein|nr:FmdB family zinc ribbon protein [Thermoanaerobaculia bacterium]
MPLYEYQCLNCGKRTEVLQRFDDPPLAACPSCGGEVKKLISSPAFQFKGTGWYVTDYAGKKGGGPPESKAKSEGKEGSGEGGGDKAEKGEKSEKTEKAEKVDKAETKSSGGSE